MPKTSGGWAPGGINSFDSCRLNHYFLMGGFPLQENFSQDF